jgi:hypothetical protein
MKIGIFALFERFANDSQKAINGQLELMFGLEQ